MVQKVYGFFTQLQNTHSYFSNERLNQKFSTRDSVLNALYVKILKRQEIICASLVRTPLEFGRN